MNIQKVIEQFGYSQNEAKVYLMGLSLGECTVSDISQKLKLPRTSVQAIVDKLHGDGLMSFYVKRRYKYWISEKPEKFLINLKEKEMNLRAAMPEINSIMHGDEGNKPIIKVYNGIEEIKLIYDDILVTKNNILIIAPWDNWVKMFGKEFLDNFIEMRIKHYLKIDLIVPKSELAVKLKEKDNEELRNTRFTPKNIDIEDTIFIYGNKVAIISLNKRQPTGILIEDQSTSNTMRVFFKEIWNQSYI
jgi:sugar-specific transcriptional regulator TrmB